MKKDDSSILLYLLVFSIIVWIVWYISGNKKDKPKNITSTQSTLNHSLVNVNFNKRLKDLDIKPGVSVFIRIFKKESLLEVWVKKYDKYVIFKLYPICAFSGHLGPKLKEGDRQSPEGFYTVKKYQLNPNSKYYLSFNLGFPNAYDKAHNRTGSYLMVHGKCSSVGCYAMTNPKMKEIYTLVDKALMQGQRYVQIHIFPFRMTEVNMAKYDGNQWYDFWRELEVGYDYFEAERLPPHVKVQNKHYTIYEANQ